MTRKSAARIEREHAPPKPTIDRESIQKKQQAILSRIGSLYIQRDNLQNQIDQVNQQLNADMNLLNSLADLVGQAPPPVPEPPEK